MSRLCWHIPRRAAPFLTPSLTWVVAKVNQIQTHTDKIINFQNQSHNHKTWGREHETVHTENLNHLQRIQTKRLHTGVKVWQNEDILGFSFSRWGKILCSLHLCTCALPCMWIKHLHTQIAIKQSYDLIKT